MSSQQQIEELWANVERRGYEDSLLDDATRARKAYLARCERRAEEHEAAVRAVREWFEEHRERMRVERERVEWTVAAACAVIVAGLLVGLALGAWLSR